MPVVPTTITAGDPAGRQLKSMAGAQKCRKVQTNHGNGIQSASRPGRRNLTENQRTYMIGKMYEARKRSAGGDRKSERFSNSQNENLKANGRAPRTDEIIGKELGVNHSTVVRAEKFAKGIDALRNVAPADRGGTLTGHRMSGWMMPWA